MTGHAPTNTFNRAMDAPPMPPRSLTAEMRDSCDSATRLDSLLKQIASVIGGCCPPPQPLDNKCEKIEDTISNLSAGFLGLTRRSEELAASILAKLQA